MRTVYRSLKQHNQAGFGHLGAIFALVVVLAVVGLVGYKVATQQKVDAGNGKPAVAKHKELTASDAPSLSTSADLTKAGMVLDQVNGGADAADNAQLNAQLNGL